MCFPKTTTQVPGTMKHGCPSAPPQWNGGMIQSHKGGRTGCSQHHHKPSNRHKLIALGRADDTVPSGATVSKNVKARTQWQGIAASWRTQRQRGPYAKQLEHGAPEPVVAAQRVSAIINHTVDPRLSWQCCSLLRPEAAIKKTPGHQ